MTGQVETQVLLGEQPALEEPSGSHTHWPSRRSAEESSPELSQVGSVVFSGSGKERKWFPLSASHSRALTPKAVAAGTVSACFTLYTPTAWHQIWEFTDQ